MIIIYTKQRVFRKVQMYSICVLFLVVEFLHPAAHGHLDHLQARDVDLLDEAQDAGQDVGVLKQSPLFDCIFCYSAFKAISP